MTDQYNLFEAGLLMTNTFPFDVEARDKKYKELGFNMFYLLNHERETIQKRNLPYLNLTAYP